MAMQMETAMATPIQTWRRASRRPCLSEERRHDAHDEGGFHALSQPDDECRNHQVPLS